MDQLIVLYLHLQLAGQKLFQLHCLVPVVEDRILEVMLEPVYFLSDDFERHLYLVVVLLLPDLLNEFIDVLGLGLVYLGKTVLEIGQDYQLFLVELEFVVFDDFPFLVDIL